MTPRPGTAFLPAGIRVAVANHPGAPGGIFHWNWMYASSGGKEVAPVMFDLLEPGGGEAVLLDLEGSNPAIEARCAEIAVVVEWIPETRTVLVWPLEGDVIEKKKARRHVGAGRGGSLEP